MKPKPKVYVESSIISYLTARPPRDILKLARQEATRIWWEGRSKYELYLSVPVMREITAGDPDAAAKRMEAVSGIPLLPDTPGADALALSLVQALAIPANYAADAAHVALAAFYGMDYLLTWNQAHITNPDRLDGLNKCILGMNCRPPKFVRPDDFPEVYTDV